MLYSRLVKENIMYTVEKLEGNKYEIKIDLSKDEFEKFIEEAYETSKDKFSVQGFRKGKAPRKVIEKNYGANIFVDDALDLAFNRLYGQALDEHREIDPISSPEIKLDKFDDTGLTITAVVENMPEVKLGAYTGLEIEGAKGEVTEEKIEKEINQTRERQARFVPTDREARLGDFVEIDFVGSINGVKFDGGEAKNYRLELGSKSFIDNFEDQLVGMKKGETRTISVKFPDDYFAEDLKGKQAEFEVTLHEVEEKILPELNDEFASNVSEFESFEEYKADIKRHMEESLEAQLEREDENKLLEKITSLAEVDVPKVMVEAQLDSYVKDMETRLSYSGIKMDEYLKHMNITLDQLRENNREHAEKTVKTRLVLEAIIKELKLSASQEEIMKKVEELASKYGKTADDYKKVLNEKQYIYFENEIIFDKLIKYLKENNTITK